MFDLLRPDEITEITALYEDMIASDEGSRVSVLYRQEVDFGYEPDPVYGTPTNPIDIEEEVSNVPCIQKIVDHKMLETMPSLVAKVGDCIFYFSNGFNLSEPVAGKKPIRKTLYIRDQHGVEWEPSIETIGGPGINAPLLHGSSQIGQAILFHLRKVNH